MLAPCTGVGTSQLEQGPLQAEIAVRQARIDAGPFQEFWDTHSTRSFLEGPSFSYAARRTASCTGIVAVRRSPASVTMKHVFSVKR